MKKCGFVLTALAICMLMSSLVFAGVWRKGAGTETDHVPEAVQGNARETGAPQAPDAPSASDAPPAPDASQPPSQELEQKILVAYFSKTGTTARVAERVHRLVGGDMIQLEAADPYPDAYQETLRRAEQELNSAARPPLKTAVSNMEQYSVIYLGYPIWHGTAPMVVFTFLDSFDLAGKTIIPFCTSGGSGIGKSVSDIQGTYPAAAVLEGLCANDPDSIEPWIEQLELPRTEEMEAPDTDDMAAASGAAGPAALEPTSAEPEPAGPESAKPGPTSEKPNLQIRVRAGRQTIVFELNDSAAARSLYEQLPLTVEVENFSDNEKIFYSPEKLDVTSALQAAAGAGAGTLAYYAPWGDVVMFYGDFNANGQLFELGRAVSGGGEIGSLSGTLEIERDE